MSGITSENKPLFLKARLNILAFLNSGILRHEQHFADDRYCLVIVEHFSAVMQTQQ
jgi:hypothetical protein